MIQAPGLIDLFCSMVLFLNDLDTGLVLRLDHVSEFHIGSLSSRGRYGYQLVWTVVKSNGHSNVYPLTHFSFNRCEDES